MNFIVGSLLLHCTEEITFWLFVSLIEDFDMRYIYKPEVPGLYQHCFVIENLLQKYQPALMTHLQ
jgi:hypothetical protein